MDKVLLCSKISSTCNHWLQAFKKSDYEPIGLNGLLGLKKQLINGSCAAVLIHLNTISKNAVESLNELQKAFPDTNVMVLSDTPSVREGGPLLQCGIKGYGNSHMSAIHMVQAVQIMATGNVWLYPEFIQSLIKNQSQSKTMDNSQPEELKKLSGREHEIAGYVAQGLSNKEIANKAFISDRTVKAHLTSIYKKLKIQDRLSLALIIKS